MNSNSFLIVVFFQFSIHKMFNVLHVLRKLYIYLVWHNWNVIYILRLSWFKARCSTLRLWRIASYDRSLPFSVYNLVQRSNIYQNVWYIQCWVCEFDLNQSFSLSTLVQSHTPKLWLKIRTRISDTPSSKAKYFLSSFRRCSPVWLKHDLRSYEGYLVSSVFVKPNSSKTFLKGFNKKYYFGPGIWRNIELISWNIYSKTCSKCLAITWFDET